MQQIRFGENRQETPRVCFCWYDHNNRPGARYGPFVAGRFIIECNTGGYGSVIINGKEFPVGPGDCYFVLPGDTVTYTCDIEQPREGVWCNVDGLQVGWSLAQAGISSEQPYAPRELFPALHAEIDAIGRMRNDTDPGAPLRRTAHIYAFLGILLNGVPKVNQSDWLDRVLGYIEAKYYMPISVDDLAKEAYLERTYFSSRFKALTGQTPHAYLNSLRIQKACTLMQQTNCSVSQVAELVGMDARNFARIFRRETGITPKEFRNKEVES